MIKRSYLKLLVIIILSLICSYSSFCRENMVYESSPRVLLEANKSNATGDDKRILLEAAHGLGGRGCNHASATVNGVTYYENQEARIMINKIAGYLKSAGVAYEISNEIVGDKFFTDYEGWQASNCNPIDSACCGFIQGTIGSYSPALYNHIDSIGTDKYLFAVELHFNAVDGENGLSQSVVMVDNPTGIYKINGEKLTGAVDKVLGTSGSSVVNDKDYLGYTLGAVSNLTRSRNIPVYYLETFFMDNAQDVSEYITKKDELAKELAIAIIDIAGSDATITDNPSSEDDDEKDPEGGSLIDIYTNYSFMSFNKKSLSCRLLLVDSTGDLNGLGNFVQGTFDIMQIASPVLVIVLTIIDIIKTLAESDLASSQKKLINRGLKRLVIGLIVVLLPYLLNWLFEIFGLFDFNSCGIT